MTLKNPIHSLEHIPDSTEAEEWLSADVFLYNGQRFKILSDFSVIKLPKNGNKPKDNEKVKPSNMSASGGALGVGSPGKGAR